MHHIQELSAKINRKNHDIAVENVLRHGDNLRMVGLTRDKHRRKFKVKH